MLEAVIFDFDGTLADTRAITYDVYTDLAAKHNITPLSKSAFEALGALPIRKRLKKHGVSIYRLPKLIKSALPIYKKRIKEAKFYPIKATLNALKARNIKLAIVSSNAPETIASFLAIHDLSMFDCIIGKAPVFGKSRAIKRALKTLDVSKNSTLYVGDERRDIDACHKISLPIIAVGWGYDDAALLKEANPTHYAEQPETLYELLINNH